MTSRPAYSPCEPAFGCSDVAGEAGDRGQHLLELVKISRVALRLRGRRERVQRSHSGQVTGIISAVAFSFIVHEPSGIIECVSDRSRASSRRM